MKSIINCKRSITGIIALLFLLSFQFTVKAQDKITGEISKTYQVTLADGTSITGKLTSITDKEIVIESGALGKVTLLKENVKTMTEVLSIDQKKSGIWFPNPNPTKYLIGSSAIPSLKKTGYYQNTWIFINTANYAFTNFLSLSGGFEILSLLAQGEGPYLFYLNPKASWKVVKNVYLGANVLYANGIKLLDSIAGVGTLNAFGTYGNNNYNITVGVGWGFVEDDFSSKPVITIGGMARASRRIAFVSENWLLPEFGDDESYYGVFSYGIRFLGEKTSIDLAFINNPDIAEVLIIGLPWLDFVFNF